MTYRTCIKCNITKEENTTYFSIHRKWMNRKCKRCIADEMKEYRKKNPEAIKASQKKTRLKHGEKYNETSRLKNKTCPKRIALRKKHEQIRYARFKEHGEHWQRHLFNLKKWRQKEEVKQRQSIRHQKYKEENLEKFKMYTRKKIENASDCYISSMLYSAYKQRGLDKPKTISKELIELKRKHLLLTRWVKENS